MRFIYPGTFQTNKDNQKQSKRYFGKTNDVKGKQLELNRS